MLMGVYIQIIVDGASDKIHDSVCRMESHKYNDEKKRNSANVNIGRLDL